MGKKSEHAPMPKKILVGDKIKLHADRKSPYVKAYGLSDSDTWTVQGHDHIGGRRRLRVEATPSLIWANDAAPAYGWQSPERREHLTSVGVKLP